MTNIEIFEADLGRADHARDVVAMVDAYAQDPMGDGKPLAEEVKRALIPGLRQHPTTMVFLARARASGGTEPVGVAVCFLGFSTFKARPLLNIHDLAVVPAYRGRRVGARLLAAVEARARALGCCKLTLEVFINNHRARQVYEAAGFAPLVYQEAAGSAFYLAKNL